eukprot:6076627-Amphidinium_carterae.1
MSRASLLDIVVSWWCFQTIDSLGLFFHCYPSSSPLMVKIKPMASHRRRNTRAMQPHMRT